jgi:hypothetical protein
MSGRTAPTPTPVLPNRAAFADLCHERKLVRAVEVGTDRGIFAEEFLDRWRGEILLCVDPWAPYPAMPYDRLPDLGMAVQRLTRFGARVRLLRAESTACAQAIGDEYHPGFVYIDGDHCYESVRADLAAWWPQVAPGGILAGHDYMPEHVGVRRAVDEFRDQHRLAVHTTEALAEYRSWWVAKP